MYTVSVKKDIYDIYELTDSATNSRAEICPERGGILLSFQSKGTELLYLDRDSFYDKEKNIRGGNPILFPICGQLPENTYSWNGKTYAMTNHGLARSRKWIVEDSGTEPCSYLKLSLSSSPETLQHYPFDFKLTYTYSLCSGKLTITQTIANTSWGSPLAEPLKMPVHTGFHPYFKVTSKMLCHDIKSHNYYDYNDARTKILVSPYDAGDKTEAVVVSSDNQERITFYDACQPDLRIQMEYSPQYKYIMLWSVPDCNFICVEPWTARNQEFLRGDALLYVSPGEETQLFMSIEKQG